MTEDEGVKARWEQTPWETLRGVWWPDTNRELVLVRAPLEAVTATLTKDGYEVRQDVLGKRVTLGDRAALAYRLRGHDWTYVVSGSLDLWPVLAADQSKALSARLKAPVIYYYLGKTAGVRGYDLYRDGDVQESFHDLSDEGMHFTSKLREVRPGSIKDSRRFIDTFFKTQDAVDAGITFEYFLRAEARYGGMWKAGEEKIFRNLGLPRGLADGRLAITRPPVERADLLLPPSQKKKEPRRP